MFKVLSNQKTPYNSQLIDIQDVSECCLHDSYIPFDADYGSLDCKFSLIDLLQLIFCFSIAACVLGIHC